MSTRPKVGRPEIVRWLVPVLAFRDDLIVVVGYKVPDDGDRRDFGVVLEVGYIFGGRRPKAQRREREHYGVRPPRRDSWGGLRSPVGPASPVPGD